MPGHYGKLGDQCRVLLLGQLAEKIDRFAKQAVSSKEDLKTINLNG